jgi:hypothetical protein
MDTYHIRKFGELCQLLSPADGSCIGVCGDSGRMIASAYRLAEPSSSEVHLFGDADGSPPFS